MTEDRVRAGHSPRQQAEAPAAMALQRELLPLARAAVDAAAKAWRTEDLSPIAEAARPYWKVGNLNGVFIYETVDGWYADVHFKNTPPGISNAIGNPAHMPLPTRAAARDHALALLRTVLWAEATPAALNGMPAFDLDGVFILLPREVLDVTLQVAAATGTSTEYGQIRLRRLLDVDFPSGNVTKPGFDALSHERQLEYLPSIALLLALGQTRFWRRELPMRKPGA